MMVQGNFKMFPYKKGRKLSKLEKEFEACCGD
jgi:hypothetical protein